MKVYYKIALIYVLICGTYIFISDYLLLDLDMSALQITNAQTVKGFVFVLFSGALILFLVKYFFNKIESGKELLKKTIISHELIFDKNPLPCFVLDADDLRYLRVNQAAVLKYGRSAENYLASTFYELITNKTEDEITAIKEKILESDNTELFVSSLKESGDSVYQHLFCQPMIFHGVRCIFAIAVDTSYSILDKQIIMDELVESLEDERMKISGLIHDSIKQCFGMIQGMLNSLDAETKNNNLIHKAIGFSVHGLDECRRISHAIAPGFDGMNLFSSLENLIKNLNTISKVKFKLELDIENLPSDEIALNFYRMVQEGTNNIISHSEADSALIRLTEENNNYILEIID